MDQVRFINGNEKLEKYVKVFLDCVHSDDLWYEKLSGILSLNLDF